MPKPQEFISGTLSGTTEAEAIASLAAQPVVSQICETPIALLPQGWELTAKPELLPKPTRKSGTVSLHEVESFIHVVKAQGSLTNTNVYLDVDYAKSKFVATAVFNDHSAYADAGHRDHRAVFSPRFSEEWLRWTKSDKQQMSQAVFASFLEANQRDIQSPPNSGLPTGSDVLTFATQLQETRKVKYGSGINLQNGLVQIEFTEENDTGTKGKLDLFRKFAIGVRPFFNGTAYSVQAFLRYRIDRNSGEIVFWFELDRPDVTLEDAAKAIVQQIREQAGVPVLFGLPG
ncbi:DUF2303 family protein [Niveibacterium sp. SC-1]|uniref:DUF2303 family protein n=1 Tax=Niveibacterium sp. SC-1 TaxID=3135646 RepID=UPI00311EDAFF